MQTMNDGLLLKQLAKTQVPDKVAKHVTEEEAAALAEGEVVEVRESDDHGLHLKVHLRDKGVLFQKTARGIPGALDKLHNLEKHIQAHREAKKSAEEFGAH